MRKIVRNIGMFHINDWLIDEKSILIASKTRESGKMARSSLKVSIKRHVCVYFSNVIKPTIRERHKQNTRQ